MPSSSTERAGSAPGRPVTPAEKALAKLGLLRDIDLALHLPLRYEDETKVVPIGALRDGETGQVEGVVRDSKIQYRPRRQLVVTLEDERGDDLVMRFLHFYPSTQKTLAAGKRVRARGETRGGFFGREMVHPSFKVVTPDTPLPTSLTPVYPSTVQLSQTVLRKAVAAGLARADLDEIVPPSLLPRSLPTLREALRRLHEPARGLDAEAMVHVDVAGPGTLAALDDKLGVALFDARAERPSAARRSMRKPRSGDERRAPSAGFISAGRGAYPDG
jgi:ATP-dependent DNA helicase RecG